LLQHITDKSSDTAIPHHDDNSHILKSLSQTKKNAQKASMASHGILELWSISCHMKSYRIQVNAPCLNTGQAGQYSIYLLQRNKRLWWHWMVG